MVLNDADILAAIHEHKLINPFDPGKVRNCRYDLRAGKVFLPETGERLTLRKQTAAPTGLRTQIARTLVGWVGAERVEREALAWRINPGDTLVVMTEETVNIPAHLLATYSPLNRLARQGLLLINASVIEPGYNGPLSCYFVNFSNKAIAIAPGDSVAKICFYELSHPPKHPETLTISSVDYEKSLSDAAQSYPKSFLNVGEVEKRAADAATKSVKTSLIWGGVIIGFLLFFNTLEPFFTKFVWDKSGVISNSSRAEIEGIKAQLDRQQQKLEAERERMELIDKQRQEHYDKMVLEMQNEMKKANKP